MSESTAANLQHFFNSSSTGDPKSDYSVTPQGQEYFSSSYVTYCESSDTTCATCRTQWIEAYRNDSLRSEDRFSCIGGGGCICTAYCELRADAVALSSLYNTGQEECSVSTDGTSEFDIQRILSCCALLLGSAVFIATVRWIVKASHEGANTVLCLNLLIHSRTLTDFRFF